AIAGVVFYYGSTSEVAWLFLLAYWIAAMVLVAYLYAGWNWWGLRGRVTVKGTESGPDSPIDSLPDQLARSGPIPTPIFEGDHVEIELGLDTTGGARGPARLTGTIGAVGLGTASGLVPRAGWREVKRVGPVARGPLDARAW